MIHAQKPKVRISVIIPHLNQPESLGQCLDSLLQGQRLPDEIIVVDNGSKTIPEAICAARPGVCVLQELQPGPGLARNKGIAAATGEILAFIDADCLAAPEWLAVAESAMSDPQATILGGDVRIGCRNPDRPTLTEAYEGVYAYRMDRYIAEQGFTGTGNLVVRRAVLADVGPFAGIEVAEDRDWGHRASAKGYSIRYVAPMRIYHPARQNIDDLFVKWDRQLGHDYQSALTSRAGRLKWGLKTVAMLPSVLMEIPRILASDRISGARARLMAFWGLVRVRFYRTGRMVALMLSGNHKQLSGGWNRS